MKWITHQTGAVLAALALEFPETGILAAWAGAIAPDLIDQHISKLASGKKGRQKLFNKIHRGNSHWFGWWGILFVAPFIYTSLNIAVNIPAFVSELIACFAFGALSHVALDMLTPQGVPILPFARSGKIGFGLCSTGKLSEYLFLAAICLAAIIFIGPDLYGKLKTIL